MSKRKKREIPQPEIVWRRHYSGPNSATFWAAVKRTENLELYSHACTLQDAEHRVLESLESLSRPQR